jgi:hypothetical protein
MATHSAREASVGRERFGCPVPFFDEPGKPSEGAKWHTLGHVLSQLSAAAHGCPRPKVRHPGLGRGLVTVFACPHFEFGIHCQSSGFLPAMSSGVCLTSRGGAVEGSPMVRQDRDPHELGCRLQLPWAPYAGGFARWCLRPARAFLHVRPRMKSFTPDRVSPPPHTREAEGSGVAWGRLRGSGFNDRVHPDPRSGSPLVPARRALGGCDPAIARCLRMGRLSRREPFRTRKEAAWR